MNTKEIIEGIKHRIDTSKGKKYSIWRIGITQNLSKRKEEHGNPNYWLSFEADTLSVAQEVETYFINDYPENSDERMSGGTGGKMDDTAKTFVYIF
jgi:hypothetical protein